MEKVFTNIEHAAWLREQAARKRPYWYGTYYLECTESLLAKKAKQYPSHYGSGRMATYRKHIAEGQICGDCVNGAIKGAVWSELGKRKPVYASHGCPDTNADGMFKRCKEWGMEWGTIDTIPDVPGVAVRMAGHVGVYVGNGEVVEWRGFKYGCVVTKLNERKWLHWYRLPWTDYVDAVAEEYELGDRLLKVDSPMMRGDDVREMQERLNALGYSCGNADGEFGQNTAKGVKEFQTSAKIAVDGIFGPASLKALKAAEATGTDQKKTVAEIADEVIDGKWGNGSERRKRLEAAGYNYREVQEMVNSMLK